MKDLRDYKKSPLITTIKERCKVCYTCVRECPARAIRITNGQAEVINERCIGCGNCTVVCKQYAKVAYNSIKDVYKLIEENEKVVAIVAPSFAAEFSEFSYKTFVGMIKQLGFDKVHEVAFGADLIARKVRELLKENPNKRYISSTCPAVFRFIKRHHSELIGNLTPIVSPMIATARVVKELYGKNTKIVFIGPCIAKKGEIDGLEVKDDVDEALTFIELREMFESNMISPEKVKQSEFNEPLAGKGTLFPLNAGMNQAVNIFEDYISEEIVAAEGRIKFIEALREFESGDLNAKILDLLCCNGCIMGAGMTTDAPYFRRRSRISKFTRDVVLPRDKDKFEHNIDRFINLDFSREFLPNDQRIPDPSDNEIREILRKTGKVSVQDELNCGACGYDTCREHAKAIYLGFAEIEMCLPYTVEHLHKTVSALAETNSQLASTKDALAQSEKLATMGQLSAGIAHELNNPLGVVLMYSNIMLDEIEKNHQFYEDISIIAQEANRCKKIVSGLLNFARQNKVNINTTNIPDMLDQCIKILNLPDTITLTFNNMMSDPLAEIDRDQIIQVINNIVNNAITAMNHIGMLEIITLEEQDNIIIKIKDNGIGIKDQNLKKIFQPFFTTKTLGQGTGLGLSVTYGIVKMHRGNISVTSNSDINKGPTGTTFTISLPKKYIDSI